MPQNALAPTPVNALNMSPYEGLYAFKGVGSPERGRKAALNVYSALLPELMRAQFPEYVATSPATVTTLMPRGQTSAGEFNTRERTIALDPGGVNSMLMEPYGKYGYIGMGNNITTEETLNALNTLLHESYHARAYPVTGMFKNPASELEKLLDRNRYYDLIDKIKFSALPSVHKDNLSDSKRIGEFLASVIPAQQMQAKNMQTKETKRYLAEYERLAKDYPELRDVVKRWEKPEKAR
jgi:hypothetical protein